MKRLALVLALVGCGNGDDGDTEPTDSTLDVACWNLRMFDDASLAPQIADVIDSLDLDIVTVEEIESNAAFLAVVNELPGWDGSLLASQGSATGGIGVMWKTSNVTVDMSDIAVPSDATSPRPTPHFVAHPVGADVSIDMYAVHLKAGTAVSDEQARIDHATAIASVLDAANDRLALVLGDFNADYDDARGPEVFAAFDDFVVLTKPVDDAGGITFLPAGIMLDHMVGTSAMDAAATGDPTIPDLVTSVPDYDTISDHLPLVARFARALLD